MYINPKIIFKDLSESENKDYFFCELCGFPHITFQDFKHAQKWDGSCYECYLSFIEARKKEWKEGWRPDKETLEEYIYKRKSELIQQEKQ